MAQEVNMEAEGLTCFLYSRLEGNSYFFLHNDSILLVLQHSHHLFRLPYPCLFQGKEGQVSDETKMIQECNLS